MSQRQSIGRSRLGVLSMLALLVISVAAGWWWSQRTAPHSDSKNHDRAGG